MRLIRLESILGARQQFYRNFIYKNQDRLFLRDTIFTEATILIRHVPITAHEPKKRQIMLLATKMCLPETKLATFE